MAKNKNIESFIKEYSKALDDRTAALFVGAGMSISAGYKGWEELVAEICQELNLDVKRENDFITLAQFYVNENNGTKQKLTQKLLDNYGGKSKPFQANHSLLASLPIETVWTTNYDSLLEDAFEAFGKQVDVKRIPKNLSKHIRGRDVTVYKMHGDAKFLEDAVLSKDQYEIYDRDREAFSIALRGDFVSKTFLFLGFSFSDPNIDYLLSRIRLMMTDEIQTHYCIMRWSQKKGDEPEDIAEYRHDRRRQELMIGDLRRYGIEAIMIDEWQEITEILTLLNRKAKANNICVSGSAYDYGVLGEERIISLCNALGRKIIESKGNLISGLGNGISNYILNGALVKYYEKPEMSVKDRITIMPFPEYEASNPQKAVAHSKHRNEMIGMAGYTIFVCGNRFDEQSKTALPGLGVLEEFKITKELNKIPIPIGATGSAAKTIWDEVVASPKDFFPEGANVEGYLQTLGDINKTNDEIIDAVFGIIREVNSNLSMSNSVD
jgi:Sir2- and TIR-associating SLOG family/SIR2-like domain